MKKIIYMMLAGVLALASCNKEISEEFTPQNGTTTFTLSIDTPERSIAAKYATRATSTVAPARYIMEVWSEDGTTAENVFENGTKNHAEILSSSGNSFSVTLDKAKAYTCLFWADDNTTFDAENLKTVALKNGVQTTEAYHAKIAVAVGKNPVVNVTLKRAVAKVILTETASVKTTDDLSLKFTNIYPTFSVLDNTATGSATEWETTLSPATETGAIATLYFFAKPTQELTEFKFIYNGESEKTVSNVPYQQNYATNIKGNYSIYGSFTYNVTADDEWGMPDIDVE